MTKTITYKRQDTIQLPAKHPDDANLDYPFSLASVDGTNDGAAGDTGFLSGRTISSIAVTAPSGITLDADSNTTTAIVLTVSGGTKNVNYEFDIDVTLSSGEVVHLTVVIPVRDPGSN